MLNQNYKPENTCISTNHSKSAELITELANKLGVQKILDYGCGMGRNIKFMMEQLDCKFVGTEIVEQLEKERENHDKLRANGVVISENTSEKFTLALNSHVLNVIDNDDIKQNVVNNIYSNLNDGGIAIFEVRTKADVEKAKTKEPYGNGFLIQKGKDKTYQEAIPKEKMVSMITLAGFEIIKHTCNCSKHIVIVKK